MVGLPAIARSIGHQSRRISKASNFNRQWQFLTSRGLILESVSDSVKLQRLSDSDSGIVELSLDRPSVKNAIGKDMLGGLQHSLETLSRDLSAKVMMINSSVPKVFCAGADLKERRAMSPVEAQSFVNTLRSTFTILEELSIPTIAVIEGAALGGGLEMALSCDLRICGNVNMATILIKQVPSSNYCCETLDAMLFAWLGEDAVMGLPETGLAIIPGAGGTQRLARLVGKSRAKELIYTGRKVSGTDALLMGLVNHCVPAGSAYSKALDIAREINEKGPVALTMAKRAINGGFDMDLASALRLEEECYEQVLNTKDRLEGLAAFAEKRKPLYTGQ